MLRRYYYLAAAFAQVSLKEDRGDLQGKLGNAVGSLEAALGSLQAETAARRDLEIDKTADTLVYSAILAVADETVRALKKEVREAESRAAGEFLEQAV